MHGPPRRHNAAVHRACWCRSSTWRISASTVALSVRLLVVRGTDAICAVGESRRTRGAFRQGGAWVMQVQTTGAPVDLLKRMQLLIVQATPFCNIDCSYCYLPHRSDRRRMTSATFAQILSRVVE